MTHGLDDITRACLTLGADERGALGDTAESFAEVPRTADKRDLTCVFVDVVLLICGCEDLGLVDVVDSDCLKDLFFEVNSTARLAHNKR